jgi:hypothetical protein
VITTNALLFLSSLGCQPERASPRDETGAVAPPAPTPTDSAPTPEAPEDTGDTGCAPMARWRDADRDGFGGAGGLACAGDPAFVDTGGDCDDRDRDVHPGAREVCRNGVDEDCDGADDTCRSVLRSEGVPITRNGYNAEAVLVDDLDDDGALDVVVGFPSAGTYYRSGVTLGLLGPGAHPRRGPDWVATASPRIDAALGTGLVSVDDLDSDGCREVVAAAPLTAFDLASDEGAVVLSGCTGATLSWYHATEDYWAGPVVWFGPDLSTGDLDDDGRVELIMTMTTSIPTAGVWVGPLGVGDVSLYDVGAFIDVSPDDAEGYLDAAGDQDVDGDGLVDLVVGVGARSAVAIVHGPVAGPGHVDDGVLRVGVDGAGSDVRSIGDADGDGVDDVLVMPDRVARPTTWWVMAGPGAGGSLSDVTIATYDAASPEAVYPPCPVGDLDGDGRADLGMGSAAYPEGGDVVLRASFLYGPDYSYADRTDVVGISAMDCARGGDLDGDTIDDVVIGAGDTYFFSTALLGR